MATVNGLVGSAFAAAAATASASAGLSSAPEGKDRTSGLVAQDSEDAMIGLASWHADTVNNARMARTKVGTRTETSTGRRCANGLQAHAHMRTRRRSAHTTQRSAHTTLGKGLCFLACSMC